MNYIKFDGNDHFASKVVCIGRNYVEHIKELANDIPDEMVIFVKPNSAISSSLSSFHQEPLHYETELCFVYQDGCFAGVGLGLDLTKRQSQAHLKAKGLPWERAKSFDGSVVFTDFYPISSISEQLNFCLHIDGELIQQGNISLMMYKPEQILAELNTFMSLSDGDVVMTGTPKGVGQINAGSQFVLSLYDGESLLLTQTFVAQ